MIDSNLTGRIQLAKEGISRKTLSRRPKTNYGRASLKRLRRKTMTVVRMSIRFE